MWKDVLTCGVVGEVKAGILLNIWLLIVCEELLLLLLVLLVLVVFVGVELRLSADCSDDDVDRE